MASNSKSWGFDIDTDKPIYVVLFISRNKDNGEVAGFKERRKSFITNKGYDSVELLTDFYDFCNQGQYGEMSRMYMSVNTRNSSVIYKKLLHFIIDNPNFNLCSLSSKVAGLAAKKECALTKRWLFDFDIDDKAKMTEFCVDIKAIDAEIYIETHKTPKGYAVITNRGFDTRSLFQKWTSDVTLKKDDLLCVHWWFDIDARTNISKN